jgi:peptide/nickel transport system substrate-binding protein
MMVRKGVVLALIAAALATAVTAAFASAGGKAKEVDTLTWALTSGPRSLDLAHTMDVNSASALALGMESLLKIDSKGRLVPNLAASYKRVNLTTYVFNLRKNVHFWDGKLMTSADVVWSLNRHVDPKSGSQISTWFAAMKKAVATGPFQVTVHLKHPDPVWIYMPASTAYIIEKAYALAKGKDLGTPSGGMMGTGPYRFTEYKPDESLTLERNDAYWGKKPAIKTIELKFITEDSTRLLALRSGQIDGTFIIPLAASKSWERLHGVTVSYAPGMNQDSFGFDMTMKPFSDIHVRRAFAYSLDRQGLVKSLLQGHGEVAVGQGAPAQWRTLTDPNKARAFYRKIDGFKLDLAKAKAELQKSAYPNGFSATIFFADGFPETGKIAQSLSSNLAKIGIKLTVKQEPTDAWVPQIFKHTGLGIIIGQSQPDYPDAWDFPAQYYASWNAHANALNWANYKNPAMDKLILAQAKAPTNAERVRLLMQAERMMRHDLAYLPVFYMETGLAISDKYRYSDFDPIYFTRNWAYNITAR